MLDEVETLTLLLGEISGFRFARRQCCYEINFEIWSSMQQSNSQHGQAMVEFVLCAITFLFVILGTLQLAMVLNAYSLVRYAAYNAARAGIVSSANQNKMLDAARISLLPVFPRHGRAVTPLGVAENYTAATMTDSVDALTFFGEPITEVTVLNKDNVPCGKVITFDDPADTPDSLLTVQVVHRYQLVMPLVNRMLFYLYQQFRAGKGYQGESANDLAARTDQLRRTGEYHDIEYRIPIVAHYTMRMQSDYVVACGS